MSVIMSRQMVIPSILIPSNLQLIENVYINGEMVGLATGYDTIEDAINRPFLIPAPTTESTSISYTTHYAIDTSGNVSPYLTNSNFSVYSSKAEALTFTQNAVSGGGAERTFNGLVAGYYLVIATESYGAVQYYAYLFV